MLLTQRYLSPNFAIKFIIFSEFIKNGGIINRDTKLELIFPEENKNYEVKLVSPQLKINLVETI